MTRVELNTGITAKGLRYITNKLPSKLGVLPELVTSRSEHRRVNVEVRLGWKTKREVRPKLLQTEV